MLRHSIRTLLLVVATSAPAIAQLPPAQASVQLRVRALPTSSPLQSVAAAWVGQPAAVAEKTPTLRGATSGVAGVMRALHVDADVARRGTLAIDARTAGALARAGLELRLRGAAGNDVSLAGGFPIALGGLIGPDASGPPLDAVLAYRLVAIAQPDAARRHAEDGELALRFEVSVQVGERLVRWQVEVAEAVPTPGGSAVSELPQH